MQNQIANWETAAVEITKQLVPLLTVVVPTLITALIAYLSLRHQRKLEEDKINGQIKLEARKLLFNSYEQDMERGRESFDGFQESLAKLQIDILFPKNEQEKREALKAYRAIMSQLISLMRDFLGEMKAELAAQNIINNENEQIAIIENFIALNFKTATEENLEEHCMSAVRVMTIVNVLQQESLNRKRNELFFEYLPSSQIKNDSVQKK